MLLQGDPLGLLHQQGAEPLGEGLEMEGDDEEGEDEESGRQGGGKDEEEEDDGGVDGLKETLLLGGR